MGGVEVVGGREEEQEHMAPNVVERSFTSNMQHGEEAAAVQCAIFCQGHAASEKSGLVSAKNGGRDRLGIVEVSVCDRRARSRLSESANRSRN